jgi:hypothetical protein
MIMQAQTLVPPSRVAQTRTQQRAPPGGVPSLLQQCVWPIRKTCRNAHMPFAVACQAGWRCCWGGWPCLFTASACWLSSRSGYTPHADTAMHQLKVSPGPAWFQWPCLALLVICTSARLHSQDWWHWVCRICVAKPQCGALYSYCHGTQPCSAAMHI